MYSQWSLRTMCGFIFINMYIFISGTEDDDAFEGMIITINILYYLYAELKKNHI